MVKNGFGDWEKVKAMDPFERLACYYGSMIDDGMFVDWSTGAITPPLPQTLRGR